MDKRVRPTSSWEQHIELSVFGARKLALQMSLPFSQDYERK